MSHEVHLVSTSAPDRELDSALGRIEFTKVSVPRTHPALNSASLYSRYTDTSEAAESDFIAAVEIAQSISDSGILVERERVIRDSSIASLGSRRPTDSIDLSIERLRDLNGHHRVLSRSKRADVHLSLPQGIAPDFEAIATDLDLTYIVVSRNGGEELAGHIATENEQWIAYTIQFDGPHAREWALMAFNSLVDLVLATSGAVVGTAKVEIAASLFMNDLHPGIPAVRAA